MNTTKVEPSEPVAGPVERPVRPLSDERGPLGALRFELRKVLAACASDRCAPEIGAKLEALLDAPQWDAAAATYHDFRRECNDTDAVLHALGLDPVKCRTDGGSLKLVMLLGALEHRDVMTRREARKKERERCAALCEGLARVMTPDRRSTAEDLARAIREDQP